MNGLHNDFISSLPRADVSSELVELADGSWELADERVSDEEAKYLFGISVVACLRTVASLHTLPIYRWQGNAAEWTEFAVRLHPGLVLYIASNLSFLRESGCDLSIEDEKLRGVPHKFLKLVRGSSGTPANAAMSRALIFLGKFLANIDTSLYPRLGLRDESVPATLRSAFRVLEPLGMSWIVADCPLNGTQLFALTLLPHLVPAIISSGLISNGMFLCDANFPFEWGDFHHPLPPPIFCRNCSAIIEELDGLPSLVFVVDAQGELDCQETQEAAASMADLIIARVAVVAVCPADSAGRSCPGS